MNKEKTKMKTKLNLPIMIEQLTLDLKDLDSEYTHDKRNVLTVSEIQKAGFIYIAYPAFVVHTETDEVWNKEKTWESSEGCPKLTKTFLLGEVKEWDTRHIIKPEVKQQAIDQMKKLGIKWVNQVYFGEIFIPKDQINGSRYYHMFARAEIKRVLTFS